MRKLMMIMMMMAMTVSFGCGDKAEEPAKTEVTKTEAAKTEAPKEVPNEASATETIKVGFGGALLGNLASYGLSGLYGLEYVVLKTNASGGLLGRQVEIVTEDDGCKPALASSAAAKLAGDGVTLILGHTCSGATSSALSAYGNKVLLISPSATEVNLTEGGKNPYFFRTIMRDDVQADLQVAFLKKRGYKKVALVHDKGDYGKALADRAKMLLEADADSGIEIVLFEGVTSGQMSYDALISKLKNSGAEVLLWGGYYSDGSKLATQMRAKKVDTIIVGADGLKNDGYIKMAGEAAQGTFATGPADLSAGADHSVAIAEALADHGKRHTEVVGPYFFYSIAAAQALFDAVEKVGNTTDLAAIKKQLQTETVETILGPVRFDEKGDLIGSSAVMYEIQDGKFVQVDM